MSFPFNWFLVARSHLNLPTDALAKDAEEGLGPSRGVFHSPCSTVKVGLEYHFQSIMLALFGSKLPLMTL